ncbi:MAG: class I SAM-dependent methyltransferase, partial [Acidobacteriota bacterium]
MNAGACLRCQSTEAEILYRGRDYLSEDPFVVLSCQACGVARTGPGRFEQDPDRYYPTAYYGETGERFHGVLERLVARFRRARVQQIVRLVPEPGRVLDIGCGRGWMLSELHRLGWSATGVERSLQAAMADAGVRILEAPRLSDCRLEAETFEAITLWHSLEHLDQPWETLDEAARLLAPGGVLIVEVPNLASLQARWSGSQWFHLDAPRHRIHLTLDQLVADLESRGLEILSRRTFSLEYGPYGMMQSLL